MKENFSSYFNKHNTKGNKGKENALEWLDKIVYARVETDYNYHMFDLLKNNKSLAAWNEQNEPEHWAMSKFPKKRWDKTTTNLAESFNVWLRNERHHSICSFIIKHMTKLGAMLVKHIAESNAWKGIIGLKIEEKVKINIAKGEVYSVSPFKETFYVLFVGDLVLKVKLRNNHVHVVVGKCRAFHVIMHA